MRRIIAALLVSLALTAPASAGPNAWDTRQLYHWCFDDPSKKQRCDGYIAGVLDMHTMLALDGVALFCLPTPDKLPWARMYGLVLTELRRQAANDFPEMYAVLVVRDALAPLFPPNADGTCNNLF